MMAFSQWLSRLWESPSPKTALISQAYREPDLDAIEFRDAVLSRNARSPFSSQARDAGTPREATNLSQRMPLLCVGLRNDVAKVNLE
jgi:hypothetical protein